MKRNKYRLFEKQLRYIDYRLSNSKMLDFLNYIDSHMTGTQVILFISVYIVYFILY